MPTPATSAHLKAILTPRRSWIKWAEQDVLNVYTAERPWSLRVLPCFFNVRPGCLCPDAGLNRLVILHGNSHKFEAPFKVKFSDLVNPWWYLPMPSDPDR